MESMYDKRSPESKDNRVPEDVGVGNSGKTKVTNPEPPFQARLVELLSGMAFSTAPMTVNPESRTPPQRTSGISQLLLDHLTSAMIDERYEDHDPGFKGIYQLLLKSMVPVTFKRVILIGILTQQLVEYNRAKRMLYSLFYPVNSPMKSQADDRKGKRDDLLFAETQLAAYGTDAADSDAIELAELAQYLGDQIPSFKENAERDKKSYSPGVHDEFCRKWRLVGPFEKKFSDPKYVASVLRGEADASAEEDLAMREVLVEAIRVKKFYMGLSTGEINYRADGRSLELAHVPSLVVAHGRNLRSIERAISETIRELEDSVGFALADIEGS